MKLAHIGRPFEAKRRRRSPLSNPCAARKSSVIDPRPVAGLGQSWHRWSCEFPGQMNHSDTRKHTEDVVTSQQNELLYDKFRKRRLRLIEKLRFALQARCRGRACMIPKQTRQNGNGLMVRRRLVDKSDPKMAGRFTTHPWAFFNPEWHPRPCEWL